MHFRRNRNAWDFADIDKSQPLAEQIAHRIREAIAAGRWRQGEELPGSGEIARRYGVAPGTAHLALQRLAEDGLVRSSGPGRGYFVRGGS